jgi:outer membrane protein assembly factor BamB
MNSLRSARVLTICLFLCLLTLGPLAGTLARAQDPTGNDIDSGVTGCPSGKVCLTTYQSGVSRRGQNNSESALTWSALTSTSSPHFHQLRSVPVAGAVYAQPLILPNVVINSTTYANVIYAATQQDWVYAIDAATGSILWSDNLANYQTGRTWLTVHRGRASGNSGQVYRSERREWASCDRNGGQYTTQFRRPYRDIWRELTRGKGVTL